MELSALLQSLCGMFVLICYYALYLSVFVSSQVFASSIMDFSVGNIVPYDRGVFWLSVN